MKKIVAVIILLLLLLGIIGYFIFGKSSGNENDGNIGECRVDTDCVPATCCHPNSCVLVARKLDCSGAFCTMDCAPGTLDCNQGYCGCIQGKCEAIFTQK